MRSIRRALRETFVSKHKIAVLGAGNAGHAVAADLALGGADIRLYAMPGFSRKLEAIREQGAIELTGIGRTGRAKVTVTTNIETALAGADLALVVAQAAAHEGLAELCAPHLRDGQAVVFFTGAYGGSLLLRRAVHRLGCRVRVLIGDTVTLPYFCRLTGPAQVRRHGKPYKSLLMAATPVKDTAELVARVRAIYPFVRPADSVLEVMLLNPNVLRHPPAVLLNIGRIEYSRGEFWIYREGFTPSVWRVTDKLDEEKMALMRALAFRPLPYREYRAMMHDLSLEEHAQVGSKGPSSADTRYLTEDVPMGLVFWVELGARLNVPLPTCRSLVHLTSLINGRDYAVEGRTLARLGLDAVPAERLREAVDHGWFGREALGSA